MAEKEMNLSVKIGDLVLISLAANELANVRMVDSQHRHICAAPGSALSDFTKGLIIDP